MKKYLQWETVYQVGEDFVYYDKKSKLKFLVCIDENPEVANFRTAKEAKHFLKCYKKILPIIIERGIITTT